MKNYLDDTISTLREYWKTDILAGFMVFLLALPLSLGIAKASGFPPAMGVLSAMAGGMAMLFFPVAPLTIKGPAAGLITISAAAMLEFGGDEQAWHIVSGVVFVVAILQILTGLFKFGSFGDFFPHAAVHGMLASIGIIIILKQIPVLLGDSPDLYQGEGPIELFFDIPTFVAHANWHIAAIGILGLLIMFVYPRVNLRFIKIVPAPLVVLLVAVPLTTLWHFRQTEPDYSLVQIGDFWGSISINLSFDSISTFTFWKYVFMFYFVSTLESLLTVKAIDSLDPSRRISNTNGDLIGQGSGNLLAGLLGGPPIISEVVRSSANVSFGAKSKWSNFFHGLFLLTAMIFMIPIIELIPNAALAAMLIYAGFNLAAPRHFTHAFQVGKDQFVIFIVTVLVTLVEDLLLGIAAGVLAKLLIEIVYGVSLRSFIQPRFTIVHKEETLVIQVWDAALFSNIPRYKKIIEKNINKFRIVIDLSRAKYIDHSFISFVSFLEQETDASAFKVVGLEEHMSLSAHPFAARKLKK